jgi:FG-GAP-like repeat
MTRLRLQKSVHLLVLCPCMAVAACAAETGVEQVGEPSVDTNVAGLPVRDASGAPRNYGPEELNAGAGSGSKTTEPAAAAPPVGALAGPGFATLGSGIGLSGIVTARNGNATEIYVGGSSSTFGADDVWYALRFSAVAGDYQQVYISDQLPAGIRRIAVARAGAGRRHIVVALADGTVRRYDQATKQLLQSTVDPCSAHGGLVALVAVNLDGDRHDELVSTCEDQTLSVQGRRYGRWSMPDVGGHDIAVGQMDGDPGLEIATTSGHVIDAATRTVQWHWPDGFGARLRAADIDGDGRDELIAAEAWYFVWAYDVERQLPKWSIPTDLDVGAIQVADVDADGTQELLVGDGQWGSVHAYDTATQVEEWAIANPEHGVTNIAVADLTGDAIPEILWGAGASSTGSDHLYVADWQSRSIIGENQHLDGPFLGPEVGDLDGDGIDELVVVSFTSESGYESGRIAVIDGSTLTVRAVSPGVAGGWAGWTGVHDLSLRDLDGDGRPEILVATDYLYDGLIEAYSFSAANDFTLMWTNQEWPSGSPFSSVEVADIDGDGLVEVVGGGSREHTGADGVFIYAYDGVTGEEKWRTLQMGDYWSSITDLVVADIDADGAVEVAGLVEGGDIYVFDGATGALDAIIEAQGTTLTTTSTTGGLDLLVGDAAGRLSVRRFDGAGYPEVGHADLGPDPIDGLTVTGDGSLWVGSAGVLRRFDQVLGGALIYASASYGPGLGARIAFLPGKPFVFSAGGYGVHGFSVPAGP